MAAAPRSDLPTVQLRRQLAAQKAISVIFEQAWDDCMGRIEWPQDKQSRIEWQVSIDQTKAAWKAAYCDEGCAIEIERLVGVIAA